MYHYLATFFQYNKRLLRQITGGACLYVPRDGHRLASSFEVIPPPPKSWFFRGQKNENSPSHRHRIENCGFGYPKFCHFLFFGENLVTPFSTLASRAPSRLDRPRPIGCDSGRDRRMKILHFPFLCVSTSCSTWNIAKKSCYFAPAI